MDKSKDTINSSFLSLSQKLYKNPKFVSFIFQSLLAFDKQHNTSLWYFTSYPATRNRNRGEEEEFGNNFCYRSDY